jgi:hypothetical protein
MDVNIAYALVGSVNNPQAKILKVGLNWDRSDSQFKCENCEHQIRLESRVTFLDLTLSPFKVEAKIPKLKNVLSANFFEPFLQ